MENRFDTFTSSILELNRIVQRVKDSEMKKLGLKGAHAMVLYQLGRAPEGLSAVQLTDRCREDKAAISRALSQLMTKGLVRKTAPETGRAYRTPFFLTETGAQVVAQLNARIDALFAKGGSLLSPRQRADFYEALELVVRGAEQCVADVCPEPCRKGSR